jgi:hypothetical protein
VDSFRGVFHGVIEQIENGGAQVFGDSHDAKTDAPRDRLEDDRIRRKMVALQGDLDALGDEWLQIDKGAVLLAMALPELARLEDLFDGGEQAVRIGKHGGVELLPLGLFDGVALKRFEVEANAGDGRFQLVGDRVEEGILPFIAAYLTHKKDRIQNNASDKQGEENDPKDGKRHGALIQNDPADLQSDRKADKKNTEGDKEGDRSAASSDVHAPVPLRSIRGTSSAITFGMFFKVVQDKIGRVRDAESERSVKNKSPQRKNLSMGFCRFQLKLVRN